MKKMTLIITSTATKLSLENKTKKHPFNGMFFFEPLIFEKCPKLEREFDNIK